PRARAGRSPPDAGAPPQATRERLDGTATEMVARHLYGSSTRAPAPRGDRRCILDDAMRELLVSIALALAAAAALAVALPGCGGGEPTAGAATPAASAPQAVDRLVRHPHAVDPSAGVPAGESGVVVDAAAGTDGGGSDALPRPVSDAEIRRELAASGIPSGDRA